MIIYRDVQFGSRQGPPPWLEGARDLNCVEDPVGGRLWAAGPAYLLGPAPDHAWKDLGDGWHIRCLPELDVAPLYRPISWCKVEPVRALNGSQWAAPAILTPIGQRAFQVAYGDDFLPALTDAQTAALSMAEEARVLIGQASQRYLQDASTGTLDASVCARYAAALLSITHHVTPKVLARLHLLDDSLVLGTLLVASGLKMPEA